MNTNIVYPDYSNSIANLANSILKKWGLPTNGKTLELLDRYLAKDYKNVVVILLMEWADALLSAISKRRLFQYPLGGNIQLDISINYSSGYNINR